MPKRWGINVWICWIFFLFTSSLLVAEQPLEELFKSLEIAAYWDKKSNERFPTTFNHLLSTGYFTTPSARMTEAGEVGFGVAHVPPYVNINLRIQPYSHMELSGNYRIFRGFEDPQLGPHGFGNHSDRGANVKVAFFTPEQTFYRFPGLAVGIDDFMGSKKFTTYYLVGTYVLPQYGLEGSLGWGTGRFTNGPSKGIFGGLNWFPLLHTSCAWQQGFGLSVELDPTNYRKDPHPKKIEVRTPFNMGIKYKFRQFVELSTSLLRGHECAVAGSLHYNWGKSEGFLPKINDPLPYTAPVDREPLGCTRQEAVMIQDLNYSLENQGFQLTNAWLQRLDSTYILYLQLFNFCYRQEHIARLRLQQLLAALIPANVSRVVVLVESYGLVCQQYVFNTELLRYFAEGTITPYEFDILSPRMEALAPDIESRLIFQRRSDLWRPRASPRFETFLNNARGKFKYALGVKGRIEGFLLYNIFYEVQCSFTLLSSMHDIADRDFFHPSQLLNVASDYIRYRQAGKFTYDMLYLQKTWNCGRGFFSRIAGGYFQVNYGGVAGEILWYPAQSYFAIGLEGAIVKKRNFSGLGFQSRIRHFKGKHPVFHSYFTLQQCFLDLYIDLPRLCTFAKLGIGQFLARDKGIRFEVTRYFDNGFRLTSWVTFTNARDMVHGRVHYDKGIAVEVPFDFFFRHSSRRVWNHATAAWLRDAGYAIFTGKSLFEIINRERRW